MVEGEDKGWWLQSRRVGSPDRGLPAVVMQSGRDHEGSGRSQRGGTCSDRGMSDPTLTLPPCAPLTRLPWIEPTHQRVPLKRLLRPLPAHDAAWMGPGSGHSHLRPRHTSPACLRHPPSSGAHLCAAECREQSSGCAQRGGREGIRGGSSVERDGAGAARRMGNGPQRTWCVHSALPRRFHPNFHPGDSPGDCPMRC